MTEQISLTSFSDPSLTTAIERTLLELQEQGVDLDSIKDTPRIPIKQKFNQEKLNELVDVKGRGSAIPGQSLVNSPDEPRPWEQPPTYSNPHVALTSIYDTLLTPESLEGLIGSLHDGVSVLDITSIILYAGFLEGKWSPDVMMLVAEPLMYLIMSFAEQVGIDYIIYDTPISEPEDTDDVSVGELSQIMKKENFFDKMKDNLIQKNIREDAIPKELQEQIKKDVPNIKSLLERKSNTSILERRV